MTIGKTQSL